MHAHQRFIEKMGLLVETDGMPRIAGRILGLLLLTPEPLSLDALARELQVSKASASTNARLLERLGAVERVAKPGDRRDYYRVDNRMPERMLQIRLERVTRMRDLVAECLEGGAPASEEVRRRLEEMERFHGKCAEEIRRGLMRWRSHARAVSESQRAAG